MTATSPRRADPTDPHEQIAASRVGAVFDDKWTLESLLGVGGMAAVYRGRHRNGARGAIKVLHPEISRRPDLAMRFLREGYAANRVEHPGVVKALDDATVQTGPWAGTVYVVMELLSGETVADLFHRGGALPPSDVLAIADRVLAVLEAAHARGVVHRDLKPENLFVVSAVEGATDLASRVRVLDFGLARLTDQTGLTRAGVALGTPHYMAPEQARGRNDEVDGRADLFSVGATMWRLLTGGHVHDDAEIAAVLAKMATLPAPPLRSFAPDAAEDLASLVDRALAFRREDRFPDAASMRIAVVAARARASTEPLRRVLETNGRVSNEGTLAPTSERASFRSVDATDRDPTRPPTVTLASPIADSALPPTREAPVRPNDPASPALPVASSPRHSAPTTTRSPRSGSAMLLVATLLMVALGVAALVVFLTNPTMWRSKPGSSLATSSKSSNAPNVASPEPSPKVDVAKCGELAEHFRKSLSAHQDHALARCTNAESLGKKLDAWLDETARSIQASCAMMQPDAKGERCFLASDEPSKWKACSAATGSAPAMAISMADRYREKVDDGCTTR